MRRAAAAVTMISGGCHPAPTTPSTPGTVSGSSKPGSVGISSSIAVHGTSSLLRGRSGLTASLVAHAASPVAFAPESASPTWCRTPPELLTSNVESSPDGRNPAPAGPDRGPRLALAERYQGGLPAGRLRRGRGRYRGGDPGQVRETPSQRRAARSRPAGHVRFRRLP